MDAVWADDAVWSEFSALVLTPGRLEEAIRRIADTGDEQRIERDLAVARKQLKTKTDLRAKIYAKWRKEQEDGGDADLAEAMEGDYRNLKSVVESHRDMVAGLERRLSVIRDSPKAADGFLRRFDTLRDRLIDGDAVTFEEKYEALRIARTRAVMDGQTIDVYFDVFETPVATPAISSRDSVRCGNQVSFRLSRENALV